MFRVLYANGAAFDSRLCSFRSGGSGYVQARSQVFSKGGGGWSYGSKSLDKEKLLVIRVVKEST